MRRGATRRTQSESEWSAARRDYLFQVKFDLVPCRSREGVLYFLTRTEYTLAVVDGLEVRVDN
jgi:hypothetical protein